MSFLLAFALHANRTRVPLSEHWNITPKFVTREFGSKKTPKHTHTSSSGCDYCKHPDLSDKTEWQFNMTTILHF